MKISSRPDGQGSVRHPTLYSPVDLLRPLSRASARGQPSYRTLTVREGTLILGRHPLHSIDHQNVDQTLRSHESEPQLLWQRFK
jgi:hypothetical protein